MSTMFFFDTKNTTDICLISKVDFIRGKAYGTVAAPGSLDKHRVVEVTIDNIVKSTHRDTGLNRQTILSELRNI